MDRDYVEMAQEAFEVADEYGPLASWYLQWSWYMLVIAASGRR